MIKRITWTRAFAALGSLLLLALLLSLGWLELTRVAKRKMELQLSRIGKKLDVDVKVGRFWLTPQGAHLEEITLSGGEPRENPSNLGSRLGTSEKSRGDKDSLSINQMTVLLQLNPLRDAFLTPAQIDFDRIDYLKAGSPEKKAPQSAETKASIGGLELKSLDKVFAALPSPSLLLNCNTLVFSLANSPEATSHDSDLEGQADAPSSAGMRTFEAKGIRIQADKAKGQILLRLKSLKEGKIDIEQHLQARVKRQRDEQGYELFLRRRDPGQTANAWAVSAKLAPSLESAQIVLELKKWPGVLVWYKPRLQEFIKAIGLRSRFDLEKKGSDYFIKAHIQSLASTIFLPVLSAKPVGPLGFDLVSDARINPETGTFVISEAQFVLPDRDSGQYKDAPLRIGFAASGKLPLSNAPLVLQSRFTLASSSCQTVLNASPRGLLPTLQEFKLDGTVAGNFELSYDEARPESISAGLSGALFNCRVKEAPFSYSSEHLNGAFTLQREGENEGPPIEIHINSASQGLASFSQLSRHLTEAFVASEDASFFAHKGIDIGALENALKRDLAAGKIALGGSTITMQTVKNLFLTPDRTLSRKLQEIFLAWHLESILTKERILDIYMNIVELGPSLYGVADASDHYFSKSPLDLSLAESAYLATLLPNPKARYQNFCAGRLFPGFRDTMLGLLKRMLSLGRISQDRYLQAVQSSLKFNDEMRVSAPGCQRRSPKDEGEEGPDA